MGCLLVVLLTACTSAGDYRAAWCEKFCAGVTNQTCSDECPQSGEIDAGSVDAGIGDAGDVDAGDVDAGVVDADGGLVLVLDPLALWLSAGTCSPMQLSMRASDGGLIAGEVTLSLLGGLTVSDKSTCVMSTPKVTVGTLATQPVPVFVKSQSVGRLVVTLSSPQAGIQKVTLEFRARVNATSDDLDAGCTTWRARLVSTDAQNNPVSAVGEVLLASPNLVWTDPACKSSATEVGLSFENATTFYVKQGDEGSLIPTSPFIYPAQLTATSANITSKAPCSQGLDCRTRACSNGLCSCAEKDSISVNAAECCSRSNSSGVCQ